MKRLVLKPWVKDVAVTLAFMAVAIVGTLAYMNRIEKISTGEMTMQYRGE